MVIEGKCRIIVQNGKKPRKVLIYIPQDIAKDSQFPYKETTIADLRIEGKKLIIERAERIPDLGNVRVRGAVESE